MQKNGAVLFRKPLDTNWLQGYPPISCFILFLKIVGMMALPYVSSTTAFMDAMNGLLAMINLVSRYGRGRFETDGLHSVL